MVARSHEDPSVSDSAAREVRPLLRLVLPIAAGLAASTFIGVVDTIMIAPLGTVPLAGAALTGSVLIILYSAVYGFLSAAGVEIARCRGAGNVAGVVAGAKAALVLALLAGTVGALAMAAGFALLPALGQPPEVLAILRPYWLAMAALLVPVAVLMAAGQWLNAIDRPWVATGFAFLGVILNVPLNWALIHGAGPVPALGLLGAGLASLAADGIALLALGAWVRRAPSMAPYRAAWAAARAPVGRLARDGAPLALGYTGEGAAYAVVGLMLGLFGAAALAANQIVQAVGGVLYMLPLGMSAAVSVRVAQASGAAEPARLHAIARAAIGTVTVWMVAMTAALVLGGGVIAEALSADPDVVRLATAMLVAVALVQVADGVQSTALGALRGIRDFRWPTLFTLACYWLFALPLAGVLGFATGAGPLGVWAGYGAGIALAAVVLPLRYRRLAGRA